MVHLLIVTGCRRGEIMGLKWEKVDLENRKIKIDTTILYTPERGIYESETKTGETRQISVPAETISLLREYRRWYLELQLANGDRWKNSGYLFVRDDGAPVRELPIG